MSKPLQTPVAFFIFKRPAATGQVFEQIKKAQPQKLLIIADGARHPSEQILVNQTRKVVEQIDWPCQVSTNYTDQNMGCRQRVSSGLDWVFSQVERAIILEDDCLPHPTFFSFCQELLEHYANNQRIMHISGNFFQQKNRKFHSQDSYYFSVVPHIWGWASWRRAWQKYDVALKQWPTIRATGELKKILKDPAVYERWERVWDQYYRGEIDSWDGQWAFACLLNKGLSINPSVNLVSNIGFDSEARQTKNPKSIFANLETKAMGFPLVHPLTIGPNLQADDFTWRQNFGINSRWPQPWLGPIRRKFPKIYKTIRGLLYKESLKKDR